MKLLASKKDLSPRIGRWFVKLSEYNYTIEYQKGENNAVADTLSRHPVEEAKEMELTGLPMLGITITTDWVAAMQRASNEIMNIRDKLEIGDAKTHEKFTMIDARDYRITKDRIRLYVPEELRYEIVSETHRNLCHMGIDKTMSALKETYYFPKMRDFVTKYVSRCINCLFYKNQGGKKPGFLHPLDKGSEPFSVMHIDHLGPFITTERENNYVLAIICGFSKYAVLKAVKSTNTEEVVLFMREFIANYGKPKRIISDRGTAYTSRIFEEFCRDVGNNCKRSRE